MLEPGFSAFFYFRCRVRFPPKSSAPDSPSRFSEGDEVEVYSRASERVRCTFVSSKKEPGPNCLGIIFQESCGWWRAQVKLVKGEFTVVEYLGWAHATYSEIVSNERLRVKSTEPSLTNHSVIKTCVKLPEDVAAWYDSLPSDKHAEIHKEFQDAVKADVIDYIKDSGELKILSRNEDTPKKVELVKVKKYFFLGKTLIKQRGLSFYQDMHFRSVSQRALLHRRTEEVARHLVSLIPKANQRDY